jgi:hypothetical protein
MCCQIKFDKFFWIQIKCSCFHCCASYMEIFTILLPNLQWVKVTLN